MVCMEGMSLLLKWSTIYLFSLCIYVGVQEFCVFVEARRFVRDDDTSVLYTNQKNTTFFKLNY
jgi:hypothetical protein